MIVLVTGDRNWTNFKTIAEMLILLPQESVIIHGGAKGADSIAGEIAQELGLTVKVFPADWKQYGRAAGPIRNCLMLDEHPWLVFAFHNDLKKSKGTNHCVTNAMKRGIPVILCSETGWTLLGIEGSDMKLTISNKFIEVEDGKRRNNRAKGHNRNQTVY